MVGPQDLGNPVPDETQDAAPAQIQGAPISAPTSQPQPQRTLANAQANPKDIASELGGIDPKMMDDLNAGPPSAPGAATGGSFDGKMVTGDFLGAPARVTENGIPQIWNSRKKIWDSVGDGEGDKMLRQIAKGVYGAVESIPETAVSVGASLVPGGGALMGAARMGIAGATAYICRATGLSEALVNKLYNPTNLYILKKFAGVEGSPSALAVGLTTAAGQGLGELLGGRSASAAAQAEEKAQADSSVYDILQQGKPLEKAAQDAGLPLRGTQVLGNLPGGGDAASLEQGMASGKFGPVNQTQIQLANQNQAQAIGNAIQRVTDKVAPGMDFDNLDINKVSGVGGQRLNFLDRTIKAQQADLSANRAAVSELARDRQWDAGQFQATLDNEVKSKLGYIKGITNADGSLNLEAFYKAGKAEGYQDKDLGNFVNMYASVKNATARQAEALSQNLTPASSLSPEVDAAAGSQMSTGGTPLNLRPRDPSGNMRSVQQLGDISNGQASVPSTELLIPGGQAGDAQAGLTFKQISAFTDRIQDLAYSNSKDTQFSQALKNAAASSKGLEDDITSQVFKENGNSSMAQRIIDQKEKYSGVIDDLRQVSNAVSQNPDNAAKIIFNQPVSRIKNILPALSDQHKSEIAGSLLTNAAYEDISTLHGSSLVTGVNADSIMNQFFGTREAAQKSEMIFGAAAPDLKNILGIAKASQSVSGARAEEAGVSAAVTIAKVAGRMATKGFPLDKLGVVLNAVFGDNHTAKDIINTNLSDMIIRQEANMNSSAIKSSLASKVSRVTNSPAGKAIPAAAGNFLKNLMMQ